MAASVRPPGPVATLAGPVGLMPEAATAASPLSLRLGHARTPNSAASLGRGSLGRRCGSSTTTTGALIAFISDGILWASILRLARSRLCLLPLPAILLRSRPPPTALTVTVVGTDKQASLALLPPKQSAVSSTPIGIPLSADGIPKQGLARRACDHDPGVPRGPFATTRALSHALSHPLALPCTRAQRADRHKHAHPPPKHTLPPLHPGPTRAPKPALALTLPTDSTLAVAVAVAPRPSAAWSSPAFPAPQSWPCFCSSSPPPSQ